MRASPGQGVDAFSRRRAAGLALIDAAAETARACYAMARRFHEGGKLIVFGNGAAATDAQHIAVEFVHPVIVGKRALPALSLTNDVATLTDVATRRGWAEAFAYPLRQLAAPGDIALGVSADGSCQNVVRALATARELGLLTVALTGGDGGSIAASGAADHCLVARSDDPQIAKEIQVTTYHVLWELVHVFFEHADLLGRAVETPALRPVPRAAEALAPAGAACVTCGDVAVPVRLIALLPDGMARVDTGGALEEVSVELVEAAGPGDTLLVHAGVAIARIDGDPGRPAARALSPAAPGGEGP